MTLLVAASGRFSLPEVPAEEYEDLAPSSGGVGHDEEMTFMSYAGPVFPLTVKESSEGLSAQRRMEMDFMDENGITVRDVYELSNDGECWKTSSARLYIMTEFSA